MNAEKTTSRKLNFKRYHPMYHCSFDISYLDQTIRQKCKSSISQNTVDAPFSGLKKPQKHLAVSSALSSLACSRRVADYVYHYWLPYN